MVPHLLPTPTQLLSATTKEMETNRGAIADSKSDLHHPKQRSIERLETIEMIEIFKRVFKEQYVCDILTLKF